MNYAADFSACSFPPCELSLRNMKSALTYSVPNSKPVPIYTSAQPGPLSVASYVADAPERGVLFFFLHFFILITWGFVGRRDSGDVTT